MNRIMEPEGFWQVYSKYLNEERNWDAYNDFNEWTKVVIYIAKKTCEEFKLETSNEYYKIDLIGWRREKQDVMCNWWLDIAYEHENNYKTWNDELCKLCYIAADLRVVSSYHEFYNDKGNANISIEEKLKDILDRLSKEKIFRVEDSKWLFVFGPRLVCADQPFRAFTIDNKLTVIPITNGEQVIPKQWEQNT